MKPTDLSTIDIPPGRFYGPCAGKDLPLAFQLVGDRIDRFTFCDLSYRRNRASADYAVPKAWSLISRIGGQDERQQEKSTSYAGSRPFRPELAVEIWRRPDISEVIVEMRRDLAQDALLEQFAPRSIAVFMHVNDGTGEGGSDLWFLASGDPADPAGDPGRRLLRDVESRLVDGAVVITDGILADRRFGGQNPFQGETIAWEPLGELANQRQSDRPVQLWRGVRP
jgi:hypothetical protein